MQITIWTYLQFITLLFYICINKYATVIVIHILMHLLLIHSDKMFSKVLITMVYHGPWNMVSERLFSFELLYHNVAAKTAVPFPKFITRPP